MSAAVMPPVSVMRDVAAGEWVVTRRVTVADRTHRRTFVVPRGFRTDLASIPRALWWLIAPFELSCDAPVVHDWLYRHGGVTSNACDRYTRAETDHLFRSLMAAEGVSRWRRTLAYLAVRVFGAGSWLDRDGARGQAALRSTIGEA